MYSGNLRTGVPELRWRGTDAEVDGRMLFNVMFSASPPDSTQLCRTDSAGPDQEHRAALRRLEHTDQDPHGLVQPV